MSAVAAAERRADLRAGPITRFRSGFDRDLSDFRAGASLDASLEQLGATVYDRAITDAHAWLQERVDDLDAEFHPY